MDARDIIELPNITDYEYLENIFQLQHNLINKYIEIEGLPKPPIDVNTKQSQTLIKDFIGRVIEELSEGQESQELVKTLTEQNQYWIGSFNLTSKKINNYSVALNHLQNTNEEYADALHFFIELLIYVNIDIESILNYVEKYYHQVGIKTYTDKLQILMDIGENIIDNQYGIQSPQNKVNILSGYNNYIEGNNKLDLRYYGLSQKIDFTTESKCILWDIVHHLNIARNFLKNKPWKQSQMLTKELAFQGSLIDAFLIMLGFFKRYGGDSETLHFNYFKKNKVNQFRIESKY